MTHYDLAIIGTGSGNSVPDERFADKRIALLEKGTFGGTCLNVGCIPTKMFVYPADLAHHTSYAGNLGVDLRLDGVRWTEIRDRIFQRIDPISVSGQHWREDNENIDLYQAEARFTGRHQIDTGTGKTITAEQIVLAAGSRAVLPEIPGLDQVEHHTSDTIMRIDEVPRRLAIIGGGFVAAEFAHVFGSFGSEVTVINRSGALLREEDDDISTRFTEEAQERWDVRLNTVVSKVEKYDGGIRLHLSTDLSEPHGAIAPRASDNSVLDVDTLLIAIGRAPNSDLLDLDATGVEVDDDGLILVDEHQRTNVEGIWALGDISGAHQLKHVANLEARVVQHNLLHPDDLIAADHRFVPSAVFTSPQVASVGITEREAIEQGQRYVTSRQAYGDVAYGWAMEDGTGFVKLVADPDTGLLLGAHIMGAQASNLIQPLIQAMSFGQTVREVAREQYWIHPALSEVVENALLGLANGEPSTATPG